MLTLLHGLLTAVRSHLLLEWATCSALSHRTDNCPSNMKLSYASAQILQRIQRRFVAGVCPVQELRTGKYQKQHSKQREVLATALDLGLPVESGVATGVTLLPSNTVQELLANKRRHDLVQPFRLGLLKLASQETARLLASGQYELALPVAQDAVKQGV